MKRQEGQIIFGIVVAVAVVAAGAALGYFLYPGDLGPEQPLPFSHRLHANVKEINCVMCHRTVLDSPDAGMPPLETCMLCHQRVIVHYPPIEQLRTAYADGTPISWQRVNMLPDYVNFNHSMHLNKDVDCGKCHGDVKGMDRIKATPEFTMGFCIQCHRDNDATHDCFTCHY